MSQQVATSVNPVIVDEDEEEEAPRLMTIVSAEASTIYFPCEVCGAETESPSSLTITVREGEGEPFDLTYDEVCEECVSGATNADPDAVIKEDYGDYTYPWFDPEN